MAVVETIYRIAQNTLGWPFSDSWLYDYLTTMYSEVLDIQDAKTTGCFLYYENLRGKETCCFRPLYATLHDLIWPSDHSALLDWPTPAGKQEEECHRCFVPSAAPGSLR